MAGTWGEHITSGKHVAEAIDWVRHKSQDRIKLVVAIGSNSVAVAKPRKVDAEDAISFLMDLQDAIAQAIRQLDATRQTHTTIQLHER